MMLLLNLNIVNIIVPTVSQYDDRMSRCRLMAPTSLVASIDSRGFYRGGGRLGQFDREVSPMGSKTVRLCVVARIGVSLVYNFVSS